MYLHCVPNLPKGKVSQVIMSAEYKQMIMAVEALKINVIKTYQHKNLPLQEGFHADMQCLHIVNDYWVLLHGNRCLNIQFKENRINYTNSIKTPNQEYPYNVLLNALRIGNYLFCKEAALDNKVKQLCDTYNIDIINVNQGYAKCSAAVVAENAIITVDKSIYAAARKVNMDVLLIKDGYIRLPGYNYGFIGGACGKLSEDCLAFCGRIELHPDYDAIQSFTKNHGVYLLSLVDEPLLDIGGILPVKHQLKSTFKQWQRL